MKNAVPYKSTYVQCQKKNRLRHNIPVRKLMSNMTYEMLKLARKVFLSNITEDIFSLTLPII